MLRFRLAPCVGFAYAMMSWSSGRPSVFTDAGLDGVDFRLGSELSLELALGPCYHIRELNSIWTSLQATLL